MGVCLIYWYWGSFGFVIVCNIIWIYYLFRKYIEKNVSFIFYLWYIGWKCLKWVVYFKFYYLFNYLDKYYILLVRKEYGMKRIVYKKILEF